MTKRNVKVILALAALLSLGGCEWLSHLIHNEDIVAEVGKYQLSRRSLEEAVPDGLSPEDSAAFVSEYILQWTTDKIFLEKAESLLSAEEKDVSDELEEYRTTLLKYRYQQHYITERLDTAVQSSEIEAYYEEHKDSFRLDAPLYKGLFYSLSSSTPDLDQIGKKLASSKQEELMEGDSLAREVAVRFADYGSGWVGARALSREMGIDYPRLTSSAKKGFIRLDDENASTHLLIFAEIIPEGGVAPLEYSRESIRDIILSARKRALAKKLEDDLAEEARAKQLVTVY